MFNHFVGIDWSGAGSAKKAASIRVVWTSTKDGSIHTEPPPNPKRKGQKGWAREDFVSWLISFLKSHSKCLVAMDFGFGYPYMASSVVFGSKSWQEMVAKVGSHLQETKSPRVLFDRINKLPKFYNEGPFIGDCNRQENGFWSQHGVAYYRLTELAAPQAISQWYRGSGPKVAYSTVTGIAMLSELLKLRSDRFDFEVWPQETEACGPPTKPHVLVEAYPGLFDLPVLKFTDEHDRDAKKIIAWLLSRKDTLRNVFTLREESFPFGRHKGSQSFWNQVREEGWILGVGSVSQRKPVNQGSCC